MEFETLRLKEIQNVVRFQSRERSWQAHHRLNHIMGIQLRGRAVHQFPGRELTLCENTLFFFNQSEDYQVRLLEPGEAFSVHFTTYEPISTPSFCFQTRSGPSLLRALEQLRTAAENPAAGLTAAAHFYALCAQVQAQREKLYAPRDSRSQAARSYLDLHFREKDCLKKAAALCGVSRRRFNDLFCAAYQVTPNRWVILCKVRYAESLLQIDGLSVTEAAELSGFSDVYYFSKVFKRETGLTPTQYRRLRRAPEA